MPTSTNGIQRPTALHVVHSLDFGGVESQMVAIAAGAHLSHFSHSFVALRNGGAASKKLEELGRAVQILGVPAKIPSGRAILALSRVLRKGPPAVLHLHGAEAIFHGTIAGLIAGAKVRIAEEIGVPNHSTAARMVFRLCYRFTQKVIAPSEAIKEEIVRIGEATSDGISLLATPTTLPAPRKIVGSGMGFEIVYVGRFEPVKNLDILLEAFAEFRQIRRDARLSLVGTGSKRAQLEESAHELGIAPHVNFLGVSSDPWRQVRRADLFVLPSSSEGFGLSLVEAMAFGIPCLTTPVGIVPELIEEGRNGWLISELTKSALARQLTFISLLDQTSMKRVAFEAQRIVLKRFSVAKYFEAADNIYSDLGA